MTGDPGAGRAGREAPGRDVPADEVAALLRDPGRRWIVASHRNPDGDAIGSMLGAYRALREAGRDVVMWHPDPDPVPDDLRFLFREGEEVLTSRPADAGDRTLLALDCASGARLGDGSTRGLAGCVVNLDHHHDNTRFGDLNLVEPGASSTAEVVVHVLEAARWDLGGGVAEPLYVGLVTDTGRFGYSNATPEAHRVAALLIGAGIEPAELSRRLYERQPLARMRLLGRALEGARQLLGGRLVVSVLSAEDVRAAGGDDAEGIVEALRAIDGAEVAVLVRALPEGGGQRLSLRSASPRVDVSAIARAGGGGGHRAAAGVTVHRPLDAVVDWIVGEVAARLEPSADVPEAAAAGTPPAETE
jgi:phosphoesterase RecJ-like protein